MFKMMLTVLCLIQTLDAAALRGKVELHRKPNFPADNPYINDEYQSSLRFTKWHLARRFEASRLKNYEDPTDTIVYLSELPERYKEKEIPNQEPYRIYIENSRFHPRTLPIMTGSTVEFINRDPVAHDVYSTSAIRPFQTPFMLSKSAFVTFKEAGGATIASSIYEGMQGQILVLDHPYYTKPRDNGMYSMRNLRPGIYKVTCWHPDFPTVTKEVEVNFGETITIDFHLSIMDLPEALTR